MKKLSKRAINFIKLFLKMDDMNFVSLLLERKIIYEQT